MGEMEKKPLERSRIAEKAAGCFRNVAKRAFRKEERDSFTVVFKHLTNLTKRCTEKLYRGEADIFSDAVADLYGFAQEEERAGSVK